MSFCFTAAVRSAVLLPLALAACAASHTVCRTELPLEERQHLMLAPVTVDGTTVPGVFDTGAEASAVTDSLITRLGLLADQQHGSLMSGVGGEGTPQNDVLVDSFDLAGFDPGAGHYPVVALPVTTPKDRPGAQPLGALIGADAISHFDVDLDIAGRRAILYDPARCQQRLPDWTMPYRQVPLRVTMNDRLILPVTLDGHHFEALLDSGSTGSVLDLPAAEAVGATPEQLAREPGGEGFGAAGVNFHHVLHAFHTLEIAGETYRDVKLSVLDRPLREGDMLLGLDWLRHHRVWISYRRRILFIARRTAIAATGRSSP